MLCTISILDMVLLRAKCVLVGNSKVGKTALAQTFHSEGTHFSKAYTLTAGVTTCVKTVQVPDTPHSVEIYILDSSGNELYSDLIVRYWENPSMVAVVYDVTEPQSLASCPMWLEKVRSQKPEIAFPGALIANKSDLTNRWAVNSDEGKRFAEGKGLAYFETSAKDSKDVESPFVYLATEFYRLYEDRVQSLTAYI